MLPMYPPSTIFEACAALRITHMTRQPVMEGRGRLSLRGDPLPITCSAPTALSIFFNGGLRLEDSCRLDTSRASWPRLDALLECDWSIWVQVRLEEKRWRPDRKFVRVVSPRNHRRLHWAVTSRPNAITSM